MKNKHFAWIILCSFIFTFFGCKVSEIGSYNVSLAAEINDKDEKEDLTQKYKNLITSEIVTSVPWEGERNFLESKQKYGTPELLAAYCSILNDPLPGEEENVSVGASLLCGTVVAPNKVFSQNKAIGPYSEERGYRKGPTYAGSHIMNTVGGGVCKIASTLYNVAVMSNLSIVERHAHRMPVSYVPYGQDATVFYGSKDFKFKNNTSFPLLIWCESLGSKLYIGFYGAQKPPKIEWHHDILSIKRTETIYKKSSALKKGDQKVVVIGMDGAVMYSWITIEKADGTVTNKKLGRSAYLPLPTVYEVGK